MYNPSTAPLRIWGYRYSTQVMVFSHQGLIIRNGDDRVVIPKDDVLRFQLALNGLIEEGLNECQTS